MPRRKVVRRKRIERQLTVGDARVANQRAGQHFFDEGAKKFFSSRIPEDSKPLIRNQFFVTSEKFKSPFNKKDDGPRLFTVRRLNKEDSSIDTIGKFQQFGSRAAARAFAGKVRTTKRRRKK